MNRLTMTTVIPLEIYEIIFNNLTIPELCNCRLVCKEWKQLVKNIFYYRQVILMSKRKFDWDQSETFVNWHFYLKNIYDNFSLRDIFIWERKEYIPKRIVEQMKQTGAKIEIASIPYHFYSFFDGRYVYNQVTYIGRRASGLPKFLSKQKIRYFIHSEMKESEMKEQLLKEQHVDYPKRSKKVKRYKKPKMYVKSKRQKFGKRNYRYNYR